MALSKNTYTADGSTTNFNITWSYMNTSEVKVKLDGVASTAFTFSGTSVIVMNSAPSNGTIVSIYRETNRSTRAVDFEDATTLTEANLDDANTQNFYVIQELLDDQTENLSQDFDGVWDANSKRIKNVSDPTSAQDSSTKNYVDTRTIPATQIGDGTVSNDEFQRLDGVTSDIQTQLDAKAPSTNIDSANIANGTVSNTEFQRLNGVTSDIQTQLDGKAPSTIDAVNIGDGSVSNTEFQRLDGVTSDIQTQLDAKAPSTGIDATKIADGTISNTEFQYLNGATSNLQAQFDSMVDPGFAVDETDTNTAKNKFVSNNLAKGWTDTKTAFDAGTQAVPLTMDEESTPSNPASNKHKLYFKSDGTLYKLNSSGTEAQVGGDTDSVVTNASDIFTTNVRLLEQHGTQSAIMEKGFTDELSASDDMIDESASSGYTYNATDDYYKNADGATGVNSDKDYTSENNYIQQEWTTAIVGSSNATFTNGSATVTISSGSWPTNSAKGRITQDGTNWYDITTRDSATQLTLSSNFAQSTVTGTFTIRMSDFSSGVVQLSEALGSGYTQLTLSSGNLSGSDPAGNSDLANLVDGSTSSRWEAGYYGRYSGPSGPAYIKYDFGSGNEKVVTQNKFYGKNDQNIRAYKFEGSNDDSSWTTLVDRSGSNRLARNTNLGWQTDQFSNSTAYRYYRMEIYEDMGTENNYGGANPVNGYGQVNFHEWQLYTPAVENLTSEYVSVADSYAQSTDVSLWADINSSAVTETLNSQNAYYWYSFDPASSYGAGTEIVVPKPAIAPVSNGINSNSKLVIHFDGSSGGTSFTDSSSTGHTVTANGNANTTTAQKKFGTTGVLFDGTGDYLSVPNHSDWDIMSSASSEYTIDCWVRLVVNSGMHTICAIGSTSSYHWSLAIDRSSNTIEFARYDAGTSPTSSSIVFSSSGITADTWFHVALIKGWGGSAGSIACCVNGTPIGSVTTGDTWYQPTSMSGDLTIGRHAYSYTGWDYWGYMDELRISNVARWTSNFTPPTTAYSNDIPGVDAYIRPIAKNDSGTWKYNSNSSANNTFTEATSSTNDMLFAVSQAISSQAENRLTSSEISSLVDADFNLTNGFTTSDSKLTRGLTLYSASSSQNPEVSQFRINYDADSSAISLVSKQWDGSAGRPSAPSTAPETMYLFVVDEQTSGTPSYFVSRDGTTWTAVTFDASWVFSGTKMARRASIDMSATNTGTNPKFKVTCATGSTYKIHAVGLQTRG